MKKGLTVGIMLVFAVVLGGLSMGCIDAPEVITEPVIVEVPEELPEEFTGSEEFNSTTIVVVEEPEIIGIEHDLYYPVLQYGNCGLMYPNNVAGFDTPQERAYIYQAMLNDKVDSVDSMAVSQYIPGTREKIAYMEYYQGYYQGLQDKYTKMYCSVGNTVMTDGGFTIERADNSTGNGSA